MCFVFDSVSIQLQLCFACTKTIAIYCCNWISLLKITVVNILINFVIRSKILLWIFWNKFPDLKKPTVAAKLLLYASSSKSTKATKSAYTIDPASNLHVDKPPCLWVGSSAIQTPWYKYTSCLMQDTMLCYDCNIYQYNVASVDPIGRWWTRCIYIVKHI